MCIAMLIFISEAGSPLVPSRGQSDVRQDEGVFKLVVFIGQLMQDKQLGNEQQIYVTTEF